MKYVARYARQPSEPFRRSVSGYLVHVLEELGRFVERDAVISDRIAEFVPLAFQLVYVVPQLTVVATSCPHQRIGGVREVLDLGFNRFHGLPELACWVILTVASELP